MMLPFTETQSKNPETEKSNASKLTPRYQKRVQNGWVVILTDCISSLLRITLVRCRWHVRSGGLGVRPTNLVLEPYCRNPRERGIEFGSSPASPFKRRARSVFSFHSGVPARYP
ncbi:hypothetical protein QC762_0046890 [Podospora pseudocomata]|uniref:Uncharacterized protein n=1 Tax=Podospora pseudocomata TaxID=2093779 RepID=A0ABR0GP63_9PEZI|nr:hypothetical protein QC762_0046890 [Podospora pseudocomata]